MLWQQFTQVTARRAAHHVIINTRRTATLRRSFSTSVWRRAEVEITIDGKKVMIEQVCILSYLFGLLPQIKKN